MIRPEKCEIDGDMKLKAEMLVEPTLQGRSFVRGVVVEGPMGVELRRCVAIDGSEELQQLMGSTPPIAPPCPWLC